MSTGTKTAIGVQPQNPSPQPRHDHRRRHHAPQPRQQATTQTCSAAPLLSVRCTPFPSITFVCAVKGPMTSPPAKMQSCQRRLQGVRRWKPRHACQAEGAADLTPRCSSCGLSGDRRLPPAAAHATIERRGEKSHAVVLTSRG